MGKLENPMDKVADAVEQLFVAFLSKIIPIQFTVKIFRSHPQQIVSPVVSTDTCLNALVSKYANILAF